MCPPPGPIEPGICLAGFAEDRKFAKGKCFTIDEIADAHAWFGLTRRRSSASPRRRTERVTFDTPAGTQSLNISGNVFAGDSLGG